MASSPGSSAPDNVVIKARIELALRELDQLRQTTTMSLAQVDKTEGLMQAVLLQLEGGMAEELGPGLSSQGLSVSPSTARSQQQNLISPPWTACSAACCNNVVEHESPGSLAVSVTPMAVMTQATFEAAPQVMEREQSGVRHVHMEGDEVLEDLEVALEESTSTSLKDSGGGGSGGSGGVKQPVQEPPVEVIPVQVNQEEQQVDGETQKSSAPRKTVTRPSVARGVASPDVDNFWVRDGNFLVDQILVSCLRSPVTFNETTLVQEEHADYLHYGHTNWAAVGCLKLPMLHPDSSIVLGWMSIGMSMILYESVVVPYRIAFRACATGFYFAWESVINVYFMMDVVVNFLVGFYDTNQELPQLIMDPNKIAKRYVKSWFVIDIIASIPMNWFDCNLGVLRSLKLLRMLRSTKVVRFIRLFRILRLAKLKPLFDQIEVFFEQRGSILLLWFFLQLCFFLWLIAHFGACGFYAVGTGFEDAFDPMPDGSPRSWISVKIPSYAESAIEHYIYGLYYVLATITTCGYGDVHPVNLAEVVYSMGLMGVSSLVFAGVVGIMSSTLTAVYNESQQRRTKMSRLAKYMRWRAMPPLLQRNLRHYVLFMWEHNETHEDYEKELLCLLSPSMKGEVCLHVFGTVLRRAPFLAWMSSYPVCVRHLATLVNSHFYDAADLLFRYGQTNLVIYFMVQGKLVISLPADREQREPEPLNFRQSEGSAFDMRRNLFCDVARRPLEGRFARRDLERAQHFQCLIQDEIWNKSMEELNEKDGKKKESVNAPTTRTEHRIGFFRQTLRTPWDYTAGQQYFAAAPTFLGESTLLTLPDEPPSVYAYTAWCLSRAECVNLGKQCVFEVIAEHPFLKDRFSKWRREARSQRRDWATEHAKREAYDA